MVKPYLFFDNNSSCVVIQLKDFFVQWKPPELTFVILFLFGLSICLYIAYILLLLRRRPANGFLATLDGAVCSSLLSSQACFVELLARLVALYEQQFVTADWLLELAS
jgi:hypothetical protein